jgi:hypothetical protein
VNELIASKLRRVTRPGTGALLASVTDAIHRRLPEAEQAIWTRTKISRQIRKHHDVRETSYGPLVTDLSLN